MKPELTSDMLYNSDFELLDNSAARISNSSSEYFNLVGLEPTINNDYEVHGVYQDISASKYTLTVCHTPDIFSEITGLTDTLVSAHTLGGERVFPFLGPVGKISGYDRFYTGVHRINDAEIIITNGIGRDSDYRIFSPANIVLLNLERTE